MYFFAKFWPEFNSGKRVKSKVVLSFRERAQRRKTKAQSAHQHMHTDTHTYTVAVALGVESCAWKAATFIYFAAATLKDLGTCRCSVPTVLSVRLFDCLFVFSSVRRTVRSLHTKSWAQNFNLQLNATHKQQLCIKMRNRRKCNAAGDPQGYQRMVEGYEQSASGRNG